MYIIHISSDIFISYKTQVNKNPDESMQKNIFEIEKNIPEVYII